MGVGIEGAMGVVEVVVGLMAMGGTRITVKQTVLEKMEQMDFFLLMVILERAAVAVVLTVLGWGILAAQVYRMEVPPYQLRWAYFQHHMY